MNVPKGLTRIVRTELHAQDRLLKAWIDIEVLTESRWLGWREPEPYESCKRIFIATLTVRDEAWYRDAEAAAIMHNVKLDVGCAEHANGPPTQWLTLTKKGKAR